MRPDAPLVAPGCQLVEKLASPVLTFRKVAPDFMGRRRRPPLPFDFWLFVGVAFIMFGISVAIIYNAM